MNHTDEQIQAAIDAAFSTVSLPYSGSARLAIAKTFLARLEEYAPKHADDQENWNQDAEKPWSLPPPPEGHKWHREDWTKDMLPEGYRPLLLGEFNQPGDQGRETKTGLFGNLSDESSPALRSDTHCRTRRPLPSWSQSSAELLQKAEATGVDLDAQPEEPAWIPHDGGPCPLKDEAVEEWQFKFRDEIVTHPKTSRPSSYFWSHTQSHDDIIAYRVLKWKPGFGPEAKTKPEQETPEEAKAANIKAFNEFQNELHATWENADQQPWQPAPGNVVRLKSGGPEMTVASFVSDTTFCYWTNNHGNLEHHPISTACLQPVTK